MDLSMLGMVNRAATERHHLLVDIEAGKIGVTIDGKYQDDVIVELVRGVVHGELRARVRRLEADLAAMGVDVACSTRTDCRSPSVAKT